MLTEDAPAPAPEASLESDAGVPDNGELTEEAVIEGKPAKTVKVAAKPAAAKAAGAALRPIRCCWMPRPRNVTVCAKTPSR